MTQIKPMLVERACERLVHLYARLADAGDPRGAAALFAPDGVLDMPGGKRFVGPEAVQRRLEEQPRNQVSRHVMSNLIVDYLDEGSARGFCYFTLYRGTRGASPGPLPSQLPFVVGQYDDEYVLAADGWRFARRTLMFTFRREMG